MRLKMAAAMALIAFLLCLGIGGVQADNTFTTTVLRALVAMAGTFAVGLVIGTMGSRMIEDNVKSHEKKIKENEAKVVTGDR